MLDIWRMLRVRMSPDMPLWGPFGFPYECGATEADFAQWAVSPLQGTYRDASIKSVTLGGILGEFCGDCDLGQKLRAQRQGTCIASIIGGYQSSILRSESPYKAHDLVYRDQLTVEQAAERLRVSKRTIWRLIGVARKESAQRA